MQPGNSLILASGGYDNTVKFWDLPTGQSLRQLPFADSAVNCLRWTKDGNFIGAGGNSSVRIFDFNSANATHAIAFEGHSGNVIALGFDRDARWCWSASEDSRVRIWDMKTPVKQRYAAWWISAWCLFVLSLQPYAVHCKTHDDAAGSSWRRRRLIAASCTPTRPC